MDKATRRQQQFQELMKRPDIEQATQRYNEMVTVLRSRLESELDIADWRENPNSGSVGGCGDPYADVDLEDKESQTFRNWVSDGGIPDEKWTRAVEITQEVASKYDFETPPRVIVDRPGDHEITAADASGADLIIGTKINAVLQVRTGCHLKAAAHQRGTPTIPEYGQ